MAVRRFRLKEATRTRAPANRKPFTVKSVSTLRPRRDRQYLVWDAGTGAARGLAILVSPTGTRSWRAAFYWPGSVKPNYVSFGRVGELVPGDLGAEIAEARRLCCEARSKARKGEDPRESNGSHADSFGAVLDSWTTHDQLGKRGNKSAEKTRTIIQYHCAEWLKRPIPTVRPQEIEHLLWKVRDGGDGKRARPYMANRLHAHLSSLFRFASRRGGPVRENPMAGTEKPWDGATARDLHWFKGDAADEAIRSLWHAADELGGDEGRFIKLLVLTGKRRGVLEQMRWEEIDASWLWTPPKGSKNKRNHAIPLSALAVRVIGGSGARMESGPVFKLPPIKKFQERVRDLTGIRDFIWHGVRHVVETRLGDLGVLPHVRDLLFDHAPARGAGAGYDHGSYREQMDSGMKVWADYVGGLVAREGAALLR